EVPIASDGGELRRIDRLVRLAGPDGGCWWVLDYKVAAAPGDDPDNWVQLGAYRDAVARLVPGEPVRAAFITGRGELVELAP
ncbi:MAG: PD-(D/E)XK nuclease family protein, partial [Aquincola sp.]|nr:PD-(D/E)XK nuclease family protein [Aquincola sp.]